MEDKKVGKAEKPEVNPFDGMVEGQDDGAMVPVDPQDVQSENAEIQLGNFTNQIAFDSEDLILPRIRLAQGLTAEVQDGDAKPGQYLLTGFEPQAALTVVPLMFGRNRTLREADAGSVLCRSNDAVVGIGDPGGTCATCPMNKWTDGENGKRIGPRCVFSYAYICYVVEFNSIGLIEFRKTSLSAGKTLNTMCSQKGIGNFMVRLESLKDQGPRGTFYKLAVKRVDNDPDVIAMAHEVMNQ